LSTDPNIIANALAEGKRVLFLAEKQAALDVVKRRFDRAELGAFCLELHSDKASPRQVIESLKARHELGYGSPRRQGFNSKFSDSTWDGSRRDIASYLTALHSEVEEGKSPYSLIWSALRIRTAIGDLLDSFKDVELPRLTPTPASR
jgi:hypothetical protein